MVIIWSNRHIFGSYQSYTWRFATGAIFPGILPIDINPTHFLGTSLFPVDTTLSTPLFLTDQTSSDIVRENAQNTDVFSEDSQPISITSNAPNTASIRIADGETVV